MSEQRTSSAALKWLIALLAFGLVAAGIAIAALVGYREVTSITQPDKTQPAPPPPSDKIPDAPAPDNTIKQAPPSINPEGRQTTPPPGSSSPSRDRR